MSPHNDVDVPDETLEAWLTGAAFEYDVPDDGVSRVLAAAGEAPQSAADGIRLPAGVSRLPRVRVPRPRLVAAAVLLVGAVASASVWGGTGPPTQKAVTAGSASSTSASQGNAVHGTGKLAAPTQRSENLTAGGDSATFGTSTSAPVPAARGALSADNSPSRDVYGSTDQALAPTSSAAAGGTSSDSAKIVHTGTLTLTVAKGKVSTTLTALDALAAQAQGYVSSTKTTESGSLPSGTVTLRVPADSYDPVLAQARKLGSVDSQTSSGTDVTAQSADLAARMTSLKKVRNNYLALLAKAKTIGETLSVQQHVDDNQGQIDQLQGQINVLADQAAYGTLAVTVTQKAPPTPVAKSTHHRSGVAVAWDRAVNGFVTGVEALIARSGRAALVLILLAAGLLVLRLGWRIGRRRLV